MGDVETYTRTHSHSHSPEQHIVDTRGTKNRTNDPFVASKWLSANHLAWVFVLHSLYMHFKTVAAIFVFCSIGIQSIIARSLLQNTRTHVLNDMRLLAYEQSMLFLLLLNFLQKSAELLQPCENEIHIR